MREDDPLLNTIDTRSSYFRNLLSKLAALLVQFAVSYLMTKCIVRQYGNGGNGYYQLSNDFVSYASIISVALNSMAARFITVN